MIRRRQTGVVLLLAAALALAGCTPSPPRPVKGSAVTVAVSAGFTSMNSLSRTGNQSTDIGIAALTGGSFTSYDATPALRGNPEFGSVTKVSNRPLRVKYTVSKSVTWSDGTPLDAADLLLSWAAGSGALDTVKPKTDAAGTVTNKAALRAGVYFDSAGAPGLDQVSKVPVISDAGRSITMTFEHPVADWRRALPTPLVPAHVVMQRAFEAKHYSPEAAKHALIRALQGFDEHVLAPVSTVWSHGFDVDGVTPAKSLRLSSGPYTISKVAKDSVTLTANPRYYGSTKPGFETVTVRVIPDPIAQVDALDSATVDVIAPTVSAAVVRKLRGSSATVRHGRGGSYEHVDLTFDNGGPFDPARYADNADRARAVRTAFLKTIPRSAIVADVTKTLSTKAQARDSFLAMPGESGYAAIVAHNGANAYRSADIAGAKKLLAAAGVTAPIPVRILFPANDPLRASEFQRIAASAAGAGFAVQNASTAHSSPESWQDRLGDGSYDAALFGWAEHDLTVAGSKTVFSSEGSHNVSGYSSATVDKAFAGLAGHTGSRFRVATYTDIDAQLYRDAYGVPIFQFPSVVAYDSTVRSVTTVPMPPGLFGTLPEWNPRD